MMLGHSKAALTRPSREARLPRVWRRITPRIPISESQQTRVFIIRALLGRRASSEVQFGRSSRMETAFGCRRNRCHISSFLRYDMIVLLVIFVDALGGTVRGRGARHSVRRRNANGSEASMEVATGSIVSHRWLNDHGVQCKNKAKVRAACISRACKHGV